MASRSKSILGINVAVIILQLCVLAFNFHRWNEIAGSTCSILLSLLGCIPVSGGKAAGCLIALYGCLLLADLALQLVNVALLVYFQWVVIQYCIHLNVSVDISEYEGVSCNDWWHFGYGEINYRDRAMIVTILLSAVVVLRIVQAALTFGHFRRTIVVV